jgi:flavin-dependent dehydrogenase
MSGTAPDVIVVGGGPAGAAAALCLARAGCRVDLFEARRAPRDKPCGEGLMPAGVRALERLGLREAVGGVPLQGVRYHRRRETIETTFAEAGHGCGLGQTRRRLDQVLWDAAAATPGVAAQEGVRVEDIVETQGRVCGVRIGGRVHPCRLVVVADGARSRLRARLGLEGRATQGRVGVRAHFQLGAPPPPLIEVFLGEGVEIYTTPLPDQQLLVALLGGPEAFRRRTAASYEAELAKMPLLAQRLAGAERLDAWRGGAGLGHVARSGFREGAVLVGDAAFHLDPLTANGLSQALISAEMLAAWAPAMLREGRGAARGFDRTRRREVRGRRRLTGMLLFLLRTSRRAAFTWRLLRGQRWLVTRLLGVAAGTRAFSKGYFPGDPGHHRQHRRRRHKEHAHAS